MITKLCNHNDCFCNIMFFKTIPGCLDIEMNLNSLSFIFKPAGGIV